MRLGQLIRKLAASGAIRELRDGINEAQEEDSDGGLELTSAEGVQLGAEFIHCLDDKGVINLSDRREDQLDAIAAGLPLVLDILQGIRDASEDGKVETVEVLALLSEHTAALIEAAGVAAK